MTFYRFTPVEGIEREVSELKLLGQRLGLKGTILVAAEGVNGTVVGAEDSLDALRAELTQRFGEMPYKFSAIDPDNPGFYRFKVKLKNEIVTMGQPALDLSVRGEHVGPQAFNALLSDPDVLVIDTRNTYEIAIGTFPGAISPDTTNFREFPDWVARTLEGEEDRPVAMFCTGGIRCEKASAFMRSRGFDRVYQLDGGILSYLEHVAPEENRWEGECFVFDQRVSVDAELEQGAYTQCFACRHPLSASDRESVHFEPGVRCPHCVDRADAQRDARKLERQRQVELAESRGEQHVGRRQESSRPASSESR